MAYVPDMRERVRRATRSDRPTTQVLNDSSTVEYAVSGGTTTREVAKFNIQTTVETKDDSIYYNIQMNNTTVQSQVAAFQQNLPSNIVDEIDDYYLTVCRFVLDLVDIPLFVFKDNQYWVTLSYMGTDASAPILYTLPYTPGTPKNVYSYQSFCELINNTIVTAYTALRVTYPALPALTSPTSPCYLVYNPDNGVISVYALASLMQDTLMNPITLWFNSTLNYFFDNFYSNYVSQGALDHKDVQIIIHSFYGTNATATTYQPGSVTDTLIQMKQEYQATYRWSDISLIVFKSASLGTRPEYTQNPNLTSNLVSNTTAGTAIPASNILTDFAINPSAPGDTQSLAVYTPAIYRLIDLLGAKTNSIDISIFWRDQIGNEYPVTIPQDGSITVKLGFFKKSLYKNFIKSDRKNQDN